MFKVWLIHHLCLDFKMFYFWGFKKCNRILVRDIIFKLVKAVGERSLWSLDFTLGPNHCSSLTHLDSNFFFFVQICSFDLSSTLQTTNKNMSSFSVLTTSTTHSDSADGAKSKHETHWPDFNHKVIHYPEITFKFIQVWISTQYKHIYVLIHTCRAVEHVHVSCFCFSSLE